MERFDTRFLQDLLDLDVYYIKCFFGFWSAFFLTLFTIPLIIKISLKKRLMAVPITRSSHERIIPNLGGTAIFYAVTISSSIFAFEIYSNYIFIISAIIILFSIGLLDDILEVKPKNKLLAQLIASVLIVIGSNIRITSFFGIMGIDHLNYWVSVVFTIFIFLFLINAFNLIDGIDGLSSVVAIISCLAYIYTFHRLGVSNYPMVVLCLTIIGSLLVFLRFNFAKKLKIIMGDTGTMFLGFLISFMSIRFLNLFGIEFSPNYPVYVLQSAPAVVIAILIIPITDTIGVSIIRILKGKSPFSADRNHTHHRFLALGFNHMQTTCIMGTANMFIIILTYLLRHINVNYLVAIILSVGFLFSWLPAILIKNKLTKL